MKYLIQPLGENPFLTNWFSVENNYEKDMIVYDLEYFQYYNGHIWQSIEEDLL
jgi:hypothetical protein